jgi:hypothetical protein
MSFHVATDLQRRILKGLALKQKPAQIASEARCTAEYVNRVRRHVLGLSWASGNHDLPEDFRFAKHARHAEKMRERNGARHWGSILLEREVLRGELPPEFMPPDARANRRRPPAGGDA